MSGCMAFLFGFCESPCGFKPKEEPSTEHSRLLHNDALGELIKDEEITRLQRQNQSLKNQLSALETELNEATTKHSREMQQQMDKVQLAQRPVLVSDVSDQKVQMEEPMRDEEPLYQQIETLKQTIVSTQLQLREAQSQIDALLVDKAQMMEDTSRLESDNADLMRRLRPISQCLTPNAEPFESGDDRVESEAKIRRLSTELSAVHQQIQLKNAESEQLAQAQRDQMQRHGVQCAEYRQQFERLQTANDESSKRRQTAELHVEEMESEAVQRRAEHAKTRELAMCQSKKIESLDAQIASLMTSERQSAMSQSKKMEALDATIAALSASEQTLREQLSEQKEENGHTKRSSKVSSKLSHTATQIRIAHSLGARAMSLLLCFRPATVRKDGQLKDFGFLKFCRENLSEKAVNKLFSKFRSEHIDAAQLSSVLTLTVIIYRVKLHQLRHGGQQKPKVDSARIKAMVQHLALFVVRTFGQRKEQSELICVRDDDGNDIKGEFFGYAFAATKTQFAENIAKWIEAYIECDGNVNLQRNEH